MMIWRGALLGAGIRLRAGGSVRRGVRAVTAAGAAVLCAGLLTGGAAASAAAAAAGARAAVPGVQWGRAEKVPGSGRLNTWGNAGVSSLSCWSASNCAAGGYYSTASGQHPFVVAERNGQWGKAKLVPGLAVLNTGGKAAITSLSCAPGGYCMAGGYYTDAIDHTQGFVVTGVKGRWRGAVRVPGLATLNTSGSAQVNSVSCPAAGKCTAAGSYTGTSGGQGFVVSQASGVWGTAQVVPGLAVLNVGGNADVALVSCGSAGNCAAAGPYIDSSGAQQVFVESEVSGVWGTAEQVPGTGALNTAGDAQVNSVSCARDGYCALGGSDEFADPSLGYAYANPFVTSGRNGHWHAPVTLDGEVVEGYDSAIYSVSCPSAGSCVAVGGTDGACCDSEGDTYSQASVLAQTKGVWRWHALRGSWAQGFAYSVSCPSAGNCGAGGAGGGGYYGGAFVASETNGRWAKAEQVPGMNTIAAFGAQLNSVSCPSVGHCTAAGTYQDDNNTGQAFVNTPS